MVARFFYPQRGCCFASGFFILVFVGAAFSVPFLAGDRFGQTVETLIYQWIKIDLNWPGAAGWQYCR